LSNEFISSPLALESKDVSKEAPVSAHRTLPHGRRVDVLAQRLALHIESLVPRGRARCLDIGCGDMSLAEAVQARASRTQWRCIDVHAPPVGFREDARWSKYRQFDGKRIPHTDGEFDVALLCDVLHHAPEDAAELLAEAARVAGHVLVKDQFEYGAYSHTRPRLVDLLGNRGDGRSVPERYFFTREEFVRLAKQQRLVITALDSGLDLYDDVPGIGTLLRPDWQFIAVLRQ
jgi:SAM-dependent methyltransferase